MCGVGWGVGSIVILCFSTERREFQSHFPKMEKYGGTLWFLPTPKGRDDLATGESALPFPSLCVLLELACTQNTCIHVCHASVAKPALQGKHRSGGAFQEPIWLQVRPHCSGQLY